MREVVHYSTAHNKKFKGHDGSACSLLQGAKGIGKSTILMAFKDYCSMKYPDIIPVYITYSDMSSKESLLNDHTVLIFFQLHVIHFYKQKHKF